MSDLAGFGRAIEKFLGMLESSIGTIYRPRAIRNEGRAQADVDAYKAVALARVEQQVKIIESDAQRDLATRALARMRSQEMFKQANIESIIDKTIPLIEHSEIREEVDRDWLHYFFESCAGISQEQIQELWAKVLAGKVTDRADLSRKLIDCLRWLDVKLVTDFLALSPRLYLFEGFFAQDVKLKKMKLSSIGFPFNPKPLEEVGLVKEHLGKTVSFKIFSLNITCKELSDRSLRFRNFYELTHAGRQLAETVCPSIVKFNRKVSQAAPEIMERFDLRYGVEYSDRRNSMDSMILPAKERISLAVSQVVEFLAENEASVTVEKTIFKKFAGGVLHSPKTIMSISKSASGKMQIKKDKVSPQSKATHALERSFIEKLAEALNANRNLLCRPVPG